MTSATITTTIRNTAEVEAIFSPVFANGVQFYTCQIGGMVLWGYLRPEDEFDVAKVRPNVWRAGVCGDMEHWNVAMLWHGQQTHQEYHADMVLRLLDRDSTFCPQRLRRHRRAA